MNNIIACGCSMIANEKDKEELVVLEVLELPKCDTCDGKGYRNSGLLVEDLCASCNGTGYIDEPHKSSS